MGVLRFCWWLASGLLDIVYFDVCCGFCLELCFDGLGVLGFICGFSFDVCCAGVLCVCLRLDLVVCRGE